MTPEESTIDGFSFDGHPFTELFAPVLPDFEPLYWFADSLGGTPFDWEWVEANKSRFDAMFVNVPALANTCAALWRPGTLPELAPQLRFGEWTYLTGFLAGGEEAADKAAQFSRAGYGDPEYFELVERFEALFIVHVDGWWEVYGPEQWLNRLREHYRGTPADPAQFGGNYP